jgi:hypothetical protein
MKGLNMGFLLDIWADLKAKRLAPVAVALGVALIAIPALMMKGSDDPAEAPIPVLAAAPADGPTVEVIDEITGRGSKLDSYEARDPFKGLPVGGGAADAAPPTGAATAPGDAVAPPTPSTGGGSTAGTMPGVGDVAGTTGSGAPAAPRKSGGNKSGGSAPKAPAALPKPPVKHRNAFYNFRLDVKFGKPGRERRYRSLSRLTFLPSVNLPVALFMGVNEARNKALFFVYPGLNHQGEGVCIPKPTKCQFVQLAEGREHYFSAGNREFRMQLLDVKRVKAAAEKRERRIARRTAQRRAARGGGTMADQGYYEPPFLVDGAG